MGGVRHHSVGFEPPAQHSRHSAAITESQARARTARGETFNCLGNWSRHSSSGVVRVLEKPAILPYVEVRMRRRTTGIRSWEPSKTKVSSRVSVSHVSWTAWRHRWPNVTPPGNEHIIFVPVIPFHARLRRGRGCLMRSHFLI